MSHLLELDSVSVNYGDTPAVTDFSLRVREGCIACLLGPSGCGKSTLLRAIAGLEQLSAGTITLQDKVVSSSSQHLAPEKRRIGMVFQDYALFPHLNVYDNISFGIHKLPKAERYKIADELMELVGLSGYGKRYPHELSGGQQQRVALARALSIEPSIILLDEPFSNLDVELRERLSNDVKTILKQKEITAVLVTHDQEEAFAMADMIAVINAGNLQQWDTAYHLYHDPANRFVANFIGKGSFLRGRLTDPESVQTELGIIRGDRAYPWQTGTDLEILIRPDDILPDENSLLKATVIDKSFRGADTSYILQTQSGSRLITTFPSHFDYQLKEIIGIQLDIQHLIAFPV